MDELEKLDDFLVKNYIGKLEILKKRKYDVIHYYIKMIDDPYLKYIDSKHPMMTIYDLLGLRVKSISATMVRIEGFWNDDLKREGKLKLGDIIIAINHTFLQEYDITKIKKDSKIILTVLRNFCFEDIKVLEIPLIISQTKSNEVIELLEKIYSIYYIRFPDCNINIKEYIKKAKDYQYIILDLRNNLGGQVKNVYEALTTICEEGQVAYVKIDSNNKKSNIFIKKCSEKYEFTQIIILINQYTISSAELLAISLKENKNAIIIGSTSFGKVIMTKQYEIDDEHVVMVPVYRFLSPKGSDIQGKGILPDIGCSDKKLDVLLKKQDLKTIVDMVNENKKLNRGNKNGYRTI